jgi:beta-lactam-binding protein with PASTA domain
LVVDGAWNRGYPRLEMDASIRTFTEVPPLIGRGAHEAGPRLRDARLALGVIRFVARQDASPGMVLEQHPRPGRRVEPGTPVDLTVVGGQLP